MTTAKPTLSILSTRSHPQGVAFEVKGTHDGHPVELSLMVVQTADGNQMNWKTTTEWRPWVQPHDAVFDFQEVVEAAFDLVMPIAQQIWETLPSYQDPEAVR